MRRKKTQYIEYCIQKNDGTATTNQTNRNLRASTEQKNENFTSINIYMACNRQAKGNVRKAEKEKKN